MKWKIAMPALAKQLGVAFARDKCRAGCLLKFSQTTGVIVVRVTVEQIFYVAQFETELRDVVLDLWGGFHKSTIEKEMALWRRD